MAAHTYNPDIWEIDTGGPKVKGHPLLHKEFEASLGYMGHCVQNPFFSESFLVLDFACISFPGALSIVIRNCLLGGDDKSYFYD